MSPNVLVNYQTVSLLQGLYSEIAVCEIEKVHTCEQVGEC